MLTIFNNFWRKLMSPRHPLNLRFEGGRLYIATRSGKLPRMAVHARYDDAILIGFPRWYKVKFLISMPLEEGKIPRIRYADRHAEYRLWGGDFRITPDLGMFPVTQGHPAGTHLHELNALIKDAHAKSLA